MMGDWWLWVERTVTGAPDLDSSFVAGISDQRMDGVELPATRLALHLRFLLLGA